MEDLSKLSYGELLGRTNAARVKAIRYDKIVHPDRDSALRELMDLDAALKVKEAAIGHSSAGGGNYAKAGMMKPNNDVFPHHNTEL